MAARDPLGGSVSIGAQLGRLLRGRTAQNLLALYGVQFANYLLPLLTLPYLARVLGPESWGSLAVVQSFAQYLSLLVEYGFNLSATREVARCRSDRHRLTGLLAAVSGAKLILVMLAVGLAFILSQWVDNLGRDPRLLWCGVLWAVALGFSPVWFFQGLERLRMVAGLEVGTKLAALFLIFILVRTPDDAWIVLFLQGIASTLTSGLAFWLAGREVGFRLPNLHELGEAFHAGWAMFFFRSVVSLYTVGNVFILAFFLPPQQVALYAGAERLTKAFLGMLEPINRAFFPRLSHLASQSTKDAAHLARRVILVMGLGSLGAAVLLLGAAPLIVRLLLGSGYEGAVPVMRVLAVLLPMVALSNALGIQWMLVLGQDRAFNVIISSAGLLNLLLALLLVPRMGHMGMACAVVLVEVYVTGTIWLYLWHKGKTPWQVRI
jgi:PST family polysaccharide transporter